MLPCKLVLSRRPPLRCVYPSLGHRREGRLGSADPSLQSKVHQAERRSRSDVSWSLDYTPSIARLRLIDLRSRSCYLSRRQNEPGIPECSDACRGQVNGHGKRSTTTDVSGNFASCTLLALLQERRWAWSSICAPPRSSRCVLQHQAKPCLAFSLRVTNSGPSR